MRLKSWIIGDGEARIKFLPPTIPQRPLLDSEGKGLGMISACFENAWTAILSQYEAGGSEFTYCDGWVVLPPLASLPHGWLLDSKGCVMETAFEECQVPAGSVYAGFVLPREAHLARVKAAIALAQATGAAECELLTLRERECARKRAERIARAIR